MAGRITRRRLLVVGGVSAVALGSVGAAELLLGGRDEELTSRVAEIFGDLDGAKRVGRAYLDDHPLEDDERRLVSALEASDRRWRSVERGEEVRALAAARARRDYRVGSIVEVEGWLLSETEARLCALATFA